MNEIQIIQNFIAQFNDKGINDSEYKSVYKPSWHTHIMSFWFNPPTEDDEDSMPLPSGTLYLTHDGDIFIEDAINFDVYNIKDCYPPTIENAVYAIKSYIK